MVPIQTMIIPLSPQPANCTIWSLTDNRPLARSSPSREPVSRGTSALRTGTVQPSRKDMAKISVNKIYSEAPLPWTPK
ncbi:hypothetical protein D3C79_1075050 [compost metagenome]